MPLSGSVLSLIAPCCIDLSCQACNPMARSSSECQACTMYLAGTWWWLPPADQWRRTPSQMTSALSGMPPRCTVAMPHTEGTNGMSLVCTWEACMACMARPG